MTLLIMKARKYNGEPFKMGRRIQIFAQMLGNVLAACSLFAPVCLNIPEVRLVSRPVVPVMARLCRPI